MDRGMQHFFITLPDGLCVARLIPDRKDVEVCDTNDVRKRQHLKHLERYVENARYGTEFPDVGGNGKLDLEILPFLESLNALGEVFTTASCVGHADTGWPPSFAFVAVELSKRKFLGLGKVFQVDFETLLGAALLSPRYRHDQQVPGQNYTLEIETRHRTIEGRYFFPQVIFRVLDKNYPAALNDIRRRLSE